MNFQRSVIIGELWRPEVARHQNVWAIFVFFLCGKTTSCSTIFKILFLKFSSPHRSTCWVPISWNLADRKSVKSCVAYLTKNKHSPGSPALAVARIAAKICQGQLRTMYSECSRFHPNRFTLGGVIAEHVKTTKTRRKWESSIWLKPTFEPNN